MESACLPDPALLREALVKDVSVDADQERQEACRDRRVRRAQAHWPEETVNIKSSYSAG